MPVFEAGRKIRYTHAEAAAICFRIENTNVICNRHPLRVRENAAFLVNTISHRNWEDIKDDMNGAYTKMLRCCIWTVECQDLDGEFHFLVVTKKEDKFQGNNQYHLMISIKDNKACPSLVRSIFVLRTQILRL